MKEGLGIREAEEAVSLQEEQDLATEGTEIREREKINWPRITRKNAHFTES